MDRQIDSPMPMPWDLVVKKRLENAVGVPWIDTATGVLHCNQKAARLVGLDGPMTEEPHGKTSIGTVGTRRAGESGMRRTAIAWACITILGHSALGSVL
jgi:hypothetical protein